MITKRLLSVKEAATYLGLAPRTIYNAIAPGSLKPFPVKCMRYGKKVLFDLKDLDRLIEAGKPQGKMLRDVDASETPNSDASITEASPIIKDGSHEHRGPTFQLPVNRPTHQGVL